MTTTRNQIMAQQAYQAVEARLGNRDNQEYKSFAKRFPALIHGCGLAQAVAFALKNRSDYVEDLAQVLHAVGYSQIEAKNATSLDEQSRKAGLVEYLRLSRDALQAAGWLKRYVEARD